MKKTIERAPGEAVASPAHAPDMAAARPRMDWIDSLRGLATMLVILFHASVVVGRHGLEPWPPLLHLNHLFTPFRMAMLMVLSGLLVPKALAKPPRTYLMRKTGTLLYPYLLWTLAYGLMIEPAGLPHVKLWMGGSYLWFILFLFTYYVWALLLRRVPPAAIILAAALLSFLSPDDSKYEERYFFLMAFFFLGYLLARDPGRIAVADDRRLIWLAVPVVAILAAGSAIAGGINYKIELCLPVGIAILLVIGLARRHAEGRLWAPLRFVGRHSIVFFSLHYPLIYGLIALCLALGLGSVPAISAICFVVPAGLCVALAIARERHARLDYLYALPL